MNQRTYFATAVSTETGELLTFGEFQAAHFAGAQEQLIARAEAKAKGQPYRITSIVEQPCQSRGPVALALQIARTR